jgi:hypothetical protein
MVILKLPQRRWRWVTRAGLGIAAIALADLGLYAFLLAQPTGPLGMAGRPVGSRVFFVGGFLVLLGLLGLIGTVTRRATARTLIYGFTAGGGLALALIGMDTIGLPLLAVVALSIVALVHVEGRSWTPIVSGTYAAFAVLFLGIMVTA